MEKVYIFDTSALVYIYLHSRRSDAHTLLLKQKKALNANFVLAKNDLSKDLIEPLQIKYFSKIRILFSLEESPRDELFNKIQRIALDNNYITLDDVNVGKLTDLDIIRLALNYHQQGKPVAIVTDDEGIHKLAKKIAIEEEPEILYTHLFFLKMLPQVEDENDRLAVQNNIQDSYYYLNNYLKTSDRFLPYEKVINTSIELLAKSYIGGDKRKEIFNEKVKDYLELGKEHPEIKTFKPVLEIVRKRRINPEFCTETACLELMSKLREVMNSEQEINQFIFDLAHREFASYHLELANIAHKELNLISALAHIRAAAQSLAFLKISEQELEKNMEDLLFVEALLLLELGSEEEGLVYLENYLNSEFIKTRGLVEHKSAAESLLVIFGRKIGRVKEQGANLLLALAKEAETIPNPRLIKAILVKMLQDEKLEVAFRKKAAKEIVHLMLLRILLKDNPVVEEALKLLGEEIDDRTNQEADRSNLVAIKEDFTNKLAEPYKGPWEIAEIRIKKKSLWVYAWNDRLKSFWVLELMGKAESELEKAKTMTFLSGKIIDYKKATPLDDVKFRQRIIFDESTIFALDEKRAFTLW